jgi:hypothetical protein
MAAKKPVMAVHPERLEIVLYYTCPYCNRKVPLMAPTQPSMAQCDACSRQFPVVPADEKSLNFIKTILDNGRAGIDPNYF